VADVTATHGQQDLRISMIPPQILEAYGFLQCTCERYPKVLHVNKQMLNRLGVTEDSENWQEFLKENIFFMIPFEERDMFRGFLETARTSSEPITIEHHIQQFDGTPIPVTGWLSTTENEFGEQEYIFIYMCTENSSENSESLLNNSYFCALKSAYNIIFEINLPRQTIECIHGRDTSEIGTISDVRMTIESAKKFWVNNYFVEEDRPMMRKFIDRITAPASEWKESTSIMAEFRVDWIDHIVHKFLGVAVLLDTTTVLFCCRDITSTKYSSLASQEAVALNKLDYWINSSISYERPALGVLLVEELDDEFSLVYANEGVRSYMNLGQNDYVHYLSGEFPFEQFLEAASIPQDIFAALIKEHSASWEALSDDPVQSTELTATCNMRESGDKRLYTIILYPAADDIAEISDLPESSAAPPGTSGILQFSSDKPKRIFARTFGHFDLFVDGIPVKFSSQKEKELMALLIDRNGGSLRTADAISYLWGDEPPSDRVSGRYRKLAMGLKNTLTRYGIEHVLINNHGTRSIDKSAIKCDYYELLAGNEKYRDAFHNAYMTDYSWSEDTLATLWDYS
jgi:hypothetical protein